MLQTGWARARLGSGDEQYQFLRSHGVVPLRTSAKLSCAKKHGAATPRAAARPYTARQLLRPNASDGELEAGPHWSNGLDAFGQEQREGELAAVEAVASEEDSMSSIRWIMRASL